MFLFLLPAQETEPRTFSFFFYYYFTLFIARADVKGKLLGREPDVCFSCREVKLDSVAHMRCLCSKSTVRKKNMFSLEKKKKMSFWFQLLSFFILV